jgi:two-component system, NarL family, sensor kinase
VACRSEIVTHSRLISSELARWAEPESLTVPRIHDDERRRVARDMHDPDGQKLTALKIILSALENAVSPSPQAIDFLSELNGVVDQALQEIRTTSDLLPPLFLDESGFAAAANLVRRRIQQAQPGSGSTRIA